MLKQLSELVLSRDVDIQSVGVADIVCRPMEERDIVRVHHIHTDCLTHSLAEYYTPLQIRTWLEGRTSQGYWYGMLAGEGYLVAEHKGLAVAFSSWQGSELLSLFVCPERQKSGVGSFLLRCTDRFAEIKYVKATLNATGFYTNFGFQLISTGYVEKRRIRIPYVHMQRL
ncbi:sortase-like acyltransferase [Rhizobium leguminosarum bv. trifolii WSM597]|uniref:Sortase-like acyltransferase n=1 Tax=Rhizobium leguminosarum bv. trifolii WSM597 TaxID=754764 RepID=I9XD04_RHILT|nr:GNAT family N-acetyltransferase [Rhizobium leguminosarum]EJB06931.1 sortase-like acyltransferase [Rhizobium leguminosarum bv. trifolii WSM597]